MFLRDAVIQAADESKGITRPSYDELIIYPTNTSFCCIQVDKWDQSEINGLRWSPKLEDLLASDWELY